MIDKLIKSFQEASETIKEKAVEFGQGAKEKTFELIDEWLEVFPDLISYGFEMTSFSVSYAISPSIEVELKGNPEQFPDKRIEELINDNKHRKTLTSVLSSIKSSRGFHQRMNLEPKSPLILKIKVKLTPEIQVYWGEPLLN